MMKRVRLCQLGQTTVEYVLVILAAATVAILLITWAGGEGRLTELLDDIFDQISSRVG